MFYGLEAANIEPKTKKAHGSKKYAKLRRIFDEKAQRQCEEEEATAY